MGRGKGKSKKSSIANHHEDGSGEEEKVPVKRRGRPTKAHKEEEEPEKIQENQHNNLETSSLENGNKRKNPSLLTEEENPEDENGVGPTKNGPGLTKNVGFRHNGSRRKNKPRRAAEVGVSVCQVCTWLVLRS